MHEHGSLGGSVSELETRPGPWHRWHGALLSNSEIIMSPCFGAKRRCSKHACECKTCHSMRWVTDQGGHPCLPGFGQPAWWFRAGVADPETLVLTTPRGGSHRLPMSKRTEQPYQDRVAQQNSLALGFVSSIEAAAAGAFAAAAGSFAHGHPGVACRLRRGTRWAPQVASPPTHACHARHA